MNPGRFTFHKSERLCSKKRIEALFAGGSHSFTAYPLRAVYKRVAPEERKTETTHKEQLLISVSKRHFKHAVDRNRTKRLIRESYRLNKHLLLDSLGEQHIDMAFIWMSNELSDLPTVDGKMKNLLQRIGEEIKRKEENKE